MNNEEMYLAINYSYVSEHQTHIDEELKRLRAVRDWAYDQSQSTDDEYARGHFKKAVEKSDKIIKSMLFRKEYLEMIVEELRSAKVETDDAIGSIAAMLNRLDIQ